MSKPKRSRPSWDDYFMAIARIVATRSTCDRLQGGAVLVKNKRIVSSGYNGSPPGQPHCDDVGHLMEEGHCVRTIHAEHNVILQAASLGAMSTEGTTMYSKYAPCIHCAKYTIAAGVKRVVYAQVYRNSKALEYLQRAGIEMVLYGGNANWNNELVELFSRDIESRQAEEGDVDVG